MLMGMAQREVGDGTTPLEKAMRHQHPVLRHDVNALVRSGIRHPARARAFAGDGVWTKEPFHLPVGRMIVAVRAHSRHTFVLHPRHGSMSLLMCVMNTFTLLLPRLWRFGCRGGGLLGARSVVVSGRHRLLRVR